MQILGQDSAQINSPRVDLHRELPASSPTFPPHLPWVRIQRKLTGASSIADLNAQIAAGTNSHFIVGQTTDAYGDHGYLFLN